MLTTEDGQPFFSTPRPAALSTVVSTAPTPRTNQPFSRAAIVFPIEPIDAFDVHPKADIDASFFRHSSFTHENAIFLVMRTARLLYTTLLCPQYSPQGIHRKKATLLPSDHSHQIPQWFRQQQQSVQKKIKPMNASKINDRK